MFKWCFFHKKNVWMIPHELCISGVCGREGLLQSFTSLFFIQYECLGKPWQKSCSVWTVPMRQCDKSESSIMWWLWQRDKTALQREKMGVCEKQRVQRNLSYCSLNHTKSINPSKVLNCYVCLHSKSLSLVSVLFFRQLELKHLQAINGTNNIHELCDL